MTAPSVMRTVDLARRWQCSERHVRNLISHRSSCHAFRLGGKLLRVPIAAVERFEQCQNIDLSASEDKFAVTWNEGGRRFRHSLGVDSRAEADQRLARFIAAQAAAAAVAKGKAYTVADAWDGYTKALGAKPSPPSPPRINGRPSGQPSPSRNAATLTEADCQRYVEARRARGRSDSTIWSELSRLRSALRWAENKRLIDRAPKIWITGAVAATRQADDAGTSQSLYRRLHAAARQAVRHPRRDDRRSHGRDPLADMGPSRP